MRKQQPSPLVHGNRSTLAGPLCLLLPQRKIITSQPKSGIPPTVAALLFFLPLMYQNSRQQPLLRWSLSAHRNNNGNPPISPFSSSSSSVFWVYLQPAVCTANTASTPISSDSSDGSPSATVPPIAHLLYFSFFHGDFTSNENNSKDPNPPFGSHLSEQQQQQTAAWTVTAAPKSQPTVSRRRLTPDSFPLVLLSLFLLLMFFFHRLYPPISNAPDFSLASLKVIPKYFPNSSRYNTIKHTIKVLPTKHKVQL